MPLVRFDKIINVANAGVRCAGWTYMDQVPNVGELINVEGLPYTIVERGWAVGLGTVVADAETAMDTECWTYCHLRIRGQ